MKHFLALFALSFISTTAFAHPGGHTLVCKTAKISGSSKNIEISLTRSNGAGWFNPTIEVTVENKKYLLDTPDETNNYGTTFHNSPLKIITLTVEAPFEENTTGGYFSVVAIPKSVKAFDIEGAPVKWSLESEKDDCNDSNGKALFQGIFRGSIQSLDEEVNVDVQIMDCTLTYNSGMAC